MLHVGDVVQVAISTHSLLAEGDAKAWDPLEETSYFNPLPPRGGRLSRSYNQRRSKKISTHSLLAEGDDRKRRDAAGGKHFNPLPPRGGRP